MDETLLQTKLSIPLTRSDPASGLVPRPLLIARLNEGLAGPLTLVSAPAGFGKTTLVSAWLRQVNRPAAWLSLDEHDRDVARFLSYVVAALQTIRPDVGTGVLALLHATPRPRTDTLLTLLINDLAAIPEELILVLDDCHTVATPDIDQALSFLINHLPPRMHLVMISRADPNLSLARLRANGQLNELHSADLRFTDEETAGFLEQMVDRPLSAAEVAALNTRVDGWIAGVQMTALSLRQRGELSVAQFIDGLGDSQGYIMDYLIDEVLQQQPAEIQTFLLVTSILDELCAPLCAALLHGVDALGGGEPPATSLAAGDPEAQEALTYLEHANLFISPLDPLHQWYRYHPLFADLLRHRLQQAYPEKVSRLHLSASEWYAQAGRAGPAVRHALAAQAFDRAAALVEQVAPTMIQRSELAALLRWLDRLPPAEVRARPLLALYYCWGLLLGGNTQQAATRLDGVEAVLATDRTLRTPAVRSHAAALRAYLVREEGDLASAIVLSQQALVHLPEHETLPRAMVTTNLAIAHYLRGAFAPASRLLTDKITTGQTGSLMANTLSAIYLKAQLLRAQGALQMALKLCQDELQLVEQRGWHNAPAAGFLYVALGDLLGERNELSTAAEHLERGIDLGREGGHPHILIAGHVRRSWLRHRQGDTSGSHEAIRVALDLVERDEGSRFWPLPPPDCYQARLWIAQGNLAAASGWAQATRRADGERPVTYLDETEDLTRTRLLIAQGNPTGAEPLLDGLLTSARSDGRYGSLIEILVLQALAFASQYRDDEALSSLAQALELAEPEGFVRTFLDEGAPMAALLRRAVAHDRHAAYALHLLNAFDESAAAPQPIPEPLSERELEVLRLVAAGYSNQAIANELFLAVSTVKKHINNMYGKLEVRSRTQAVARARELGLL